MTGLYRACAACLLAASIAGSDQAAGSRGVDAVLAGYRAALQKSGIAGSGLLIIRDGRIVLSAAEGLQNLERREPVTAGTIFHWASITKTFTGIAIMQLRDRGRLSLDDPVVKYVPEVRLAHDPFGDIAQVKIRHLMSHSAGFRASTWPWGGDKPWHPFEPTTWEQLVAMLPYTDVQFTPGSKYSYSNPGVIFLGRIIQQLSGDDYEVYVAKNILMPLEMHSTFFDRAPYYLLPRRSHSYFRDDGGLREARFDFDTGITVSNGGLNAPLTDMAKYLAFLLGAADYAGAADKAGATDYRATEYKVATEYTEHTEYATVLRRSSLEEMWTPQIRATAGEGVNGADSSAALSFFVENWNGVTLIGHSGDQNGFISHLYLHRPSRTGWVISMNTDTTAAKDGTRPSSRDVDMAVRKLILDHVISR
jgi:CubicO group peptidase (beta-lactamase class C family)